MVNNKFTLSQVQRCLLLVVFASVALGAAIATAQEPYYKNDYRIHTSQPVVRATPAPFKFQVEIVDPPSPLRAQTSVSGKSPFPRTTEQTNTFTSGQTRVAARPRKRLQEIFAENSNDDIFGEANVVERQQPVNPFQKVEGDQDKTPANPFKAVTPRQDTPLRNPFNELPQDPTPGNPPMDTNPVSPQQVPPVLPPGGDIPVDPGRIDPNPPIPGVPPTMRPQDDENERPSLDIEEPIVRPEDPDVPELAPDDTEEPGEIDPEKENSIFDDEPEDDDYVAPVPKPGTSRVYLPARNPTEYVRPGTDPDKPDPRTPPNPYANLPGPYGYPGQAPPYPGYAGYPGYPPGYPPAPYAGYPMPYPGLMPALPYGQCSPGCSPTNLCSSCNSCASSGCGGCNSCNSCCNSGCGNMKIALVGSDIGDRIVETSECGIEADVSYVDVVSDCDNVCSNFASCYIGAFGGVTSLNDLVTQSDVGTGAFLEDSGYLFGFTVGQIQGRNLRTEFELSYRDIDVNGLTLNGSVPSQFVGVNGDFGVFAGMLNGYWEFVDFGPQKIKPYLGAGLGFAIARPELVQASGTEAVIDNNESSFAWQWMAGFNYKASPTLDAFVEYRYFVADSFRLDTEIPDVAGLGNGSGPFDYQSSSVLFGLRARF